MPLPGAEVVIVDVPTPPGSATDSGLLFAIGETLFGPTDTTVEVRNMDQMVRAFGARPDYGVLHDNLEVFFATGGRRAIVSRIVGPAPVPATANLPGSTGTSLVATAVSVGEWANGHTVEITANGSDRILFVKDQTGDTVDRSPTVSTKAALIEWANTKSQYIRLAAGADASLPIAGTVTLESGTADRANITDTEELAAADRFSPEDGIGQLAAPGRYSEDLHVGLLERAWNTRRFAVLDPDPTLDGDDLAAYAGVLRDTGKGRWGILVGPRIKVAAPGGGTRTLPASGFWCGRAAYTDRVAGPGQPPAGDTYGENIRILDVETVYDDTDRDRLNEAGVVVVHRVQRRPRIYGARTLGDDVIEPAYRWVNGTRVVMGFQADGHQALERFVLRRVDGKRIIHANAKNDVTAVAESYRSRDDLYGATPAEAYLFDAGPEVNTPESIADGWLLVNGEIRTPPVAERVRLTLAVQAPGNTVTQAA